MGWRTRKERGSCYGIPQRCIFPNVSFSSAKDGGKKPFRSRSQSWTAEKSEQIDATRVDGGGELAQVELVSTKPGYFCNGISVTCSLAVAPDSE